MNILFPLQNSVSGRSWGLFLCLVIGMAGLCAARPLENPQSSPAAGSGAPVTILAGEDWVPLKLSLEIEPGSALDFSGKGFHSAPAGKHGRVIAREDGQFAFEKLPKVAQRFYGINLCFSAQYLSHSQADRLADRLVRLGYNTLRIHHYEGILAEGQFETTQFNPQRLDQLDYLVGALARRGIYVTTDLYVSRPVKRREIGLEGEGLVGMDHFKILVPVHEGAWENWKQFSRTLLEHVNPYTGSRWADDPALAFLSLINEGNFGNFFSDLRAVPQWQKAWNDWLAKRYPNREMLAAAWGTRLKENENPAAGTAAFPEMLFNSGPRERDCILFLSEADQALTEKMLRFLSDEIKTRVLITNTNSWTNFTTSQATRFLYDYVDDHFYVDHPEFLEKSWQLPSRCPNTSPVQAGATGGRDRAFTRLYRKPFTITEYNYSAPSRYRGVGGILTGAMAALQGWGGLWRFAYSHRRENLFEEQPLNYFDMASDPLSQTAERASICLFLRGDMKPAPHSVTLAMTLKDLETPPARVPQLAARWHWLSWLTRLGTDVLSEPGGVYFGDLIFPLNWAPSSKPPAGPAGSRILSGQDPYSITDETLLQILRESKILANTNPTDPSRKIFQSETGEITIHGEKDQLLLDTPRTAGGFSPAGQTLATRDEALAVSVLGTDATVWMSSLDGEPIVRSKRLLLTHLTDLQDTGMQYREAARKTLLKWGKVPHLVRGGKAQIRVRVENPNSFQLWSLATSGKRMARLPLEVKEGRLSFELDVAGDRPGGARMLYELVIP
jgi:hypothetical protein